MKSILQQIKVKCEAKAKEMAALELSIWNPEHERDLKKDFGYTDSKIKSRKCNLINSLKK